MIEKTSKKIKWLVGKELYISVMSVYIQMFLNYLLRFFYLKKLQRNFSVMKFGIVTENEDTLPKMESQMAM